MDLTDERLSGAGHGYTASRQAVASRIWPWLKVAVVAAAILMGLTLLHVVCFAVEQWLYVKMTAKDGAAVLIALAAALGFIVLVVVSVRSLATTSHTAGVEGGTNRTLTDQGVSAPAVPLGSDEVPHVSVNGTEIQPKS